MPKNGWVRVWNGDVVQVVKNCQLSARDALVKAAKALPSQLVIILRFWNKKIVIFLSLLVMSLKALKIESLLSLMHQLRVFDNTARQQKTTSLHNKQQPKWLARNRWWTNWNHDPLERCLTTRYKSAPRWSKPSMPLVDHHGVRFFFMCKPFLCQTLVQNLVAYFFWEQLDVLPLCSDGSD